jgi:hypothetical protein
VANDDMDIVAAILKNLNNKMTLPQVKAPTPSFNWDRAWPRCMRLRRPTTGFVSI